MTKFSDLKLDPKVLKAIADAGYEAPTPIQAGAIPPALEGRDVLGIAQTGTGKTASFTLPMITLLGRGRARARMPRSLVLCPTRELAAQVAENFDTYAKNTRLTKALLIGGVSFGEQDKLIDRGVDVLIATPGRLLDHFERGKLLLTGVQIMVVDEADRMLDMGFIPDIERIFQLTPFTRQTLFFSATMAPEIERITDTFLHSPERIEVARQATTSETITQKLVEIAPTRRDQSAKQKRELLRALIRAEGEGLKNAIIFCNRKTEVDIVAKSLKAHEFDAAPIHGDLDQRHRMATLDDFREGKLRFLVASDVAARGLDIPAVSHVFNFDLPSHAEDYVHRIGRTGRAGRQGTAISIGTPADEKYLTAIEALVKQTLPRAAQPEGFTLSAAAQAPARAQRDTPRRDRTGRRGGRRHEDEQDRQPAPREEAAPEPRAETQDRRHRDHRNDRREDRREDRRGDRHPILGMGDHVPEFMTRSFRPAINPAAVGDAETDSGPSTTDKAENAARAEKPVQASEAPAPAPEARQDEKPEAQPEADAPAEAQAPAAEAATESAPAPAAEQAEAPKEKPVRKRKPRVAKPKPEETSAADAEIPAEAAPEVADDAASETGDKPKAARKPAKPRAPRKPRAKAAAKPDSGEQSAPDESAAQPAADTADGGGSATEG
ncbi:Superfamily II DNA and RNA helicase [Paracoccus halophilus]|uniref:DEAD-box ATP-dependent RNA helicase RhpA n=1 Tax=Paracoccus halophilus TaxID=376733 RepID=A0A099F3Z0_9RHOB|nr:DEAD/DEAH box helicase [Paracoccus halophilus]KGJ04936.1 DEAD/DEAH box helicase [Paracoccus halophilus]SFA39216.1 Superfamily II DNA and RNA helicase [Paracoccus halophilus]